MKTFAEFGKRKAGLLEAYDRVLASEILPVANVGKSHLQERRSNLEAERFFVAVCGQIKSGKSTLLNALVFGRPVLPTDDTVMTAKNTLIRHGDSPAIEVQFYSSQEWTVVEAGFCGDDETALHFRTDLKRAAEHGAYKDEYVLPERRIEVADDIDRLRQYVSPVEKGGVLSPFVKQVTVFYPHPWLTHVVLADTPGVNDPLRYREDITKQWIHKAGAVLYVTYAGQAFSSQDVQFLDDYLLHVAPHRRVVAVNKVDLVDDRPTLDAYVNRLMASDDPRLRSIFGKRGSLVYVSAEAGLIERMTRDGADLDDSLSELALWYEEKGYLDPERHCLDLVQALVEERLLQVQGADLLEEHAAFVDTLVQRKARILTAEIEAATGREKSLAMSQAELRQQKAAIEGQIERVNSAFRGFERQLRRALDRAFKSLDDRVRQLTQGASNTIEANLQQVKSISSLARKAAWFLSDAIADRQETIFNALEDVEASVEGLVESCMQEIQRASQDGGNQAVSLEAYLDLSFFDTLRGLKESFRPKATRAKLEETVSDVTNWWQRFWNTSGGLEDARSALWAEAREYLERSLDEGLLIKIQTEVNVKFQKARKRIQEDINAELVLRRREVEELQAGMVDREAEREFIQAQIAKLMNMLERVREFRTELAVLVGGTE